MNFDDFLNYETQAYLKAQDDEEQTDDFDNADEEMELERDMNEEN